MKATDKQAIAAYMACDGPFIKIEWQHLSEYWQDYWRKIANAVIESL